MKTLVCFVIVISSSVQAGAQSGQGDNKVEIVVCGDYRYITANGIPSHRHGDFPNRGNF